MTCLVISELSLLVRQAGDETTDILIHLLARQYSKFSSYIKLYIGHAGFELLSVCLPLSSWIKNKNKKENKKRWCRNVFYVLLSLVN